MQLPSYIAQELANYDGPDYSYRNEFNYFYHTLVKNKQKYSAHYISVTTKNERIFLVEHRGYTYEQAAYKVLLKYNKQPKSTRRHYDNQN